VSSKEFLKKRDRALVQVRTREMKRSKPREAKMSVDDADAGEYVSVMARWEKKP